jgi:hypothetical protein
VLPEVFGVAGPLHPVPIPVIALPAAGNDAADDARGAAKNSWLDRLLGRAPKATPGPATAETTSGQWSITDFEATRAKERDQAIRTLGLLLPVLRSAGVATVFGRYDGGNDEGFCWFDHATTTSGEQLNDATSFKRHLAGQPDLAARLGTAGVRAEQTDVSYVLVEAATMVLLGRNFGNGPLYLYGAFAIDCAAGHIADDPTAERISPDWDRMGE